MVCSRTGSNIAVMSMSVCHRWLMLITKGAVSADKIKVFTLQNTKVTIMGKVKFENKSNKAE